MTASVTVRHNFETAHRLPHLPGKCQSLHGHSWWAEITIAAADLPFTGIVVDFGELKQYVRGWIDTELDHGSMLSHQDPLARLLAEQGCKVFVFTPARGDWPTVENVARLLADVTAQALLTDDLRVSRVVVTETHVNAATWEP